MVKVQQVAALRAKSIFYLIGYPRRSITDGVNRGVSAKAGLGGAGKKLLPGCVNVALQGAAIDQLLAALGVRQTYLGLAPLQLLAFAFISFRGVGLDNGHHPTIHLNDDHCAAPRLAGPTRLFGGAFEYLLRVSLRDVPNRAFAQDNAVVLHQFVHHLGERHVRTKVGHHAL